MTIQQLCYVVALDTHRHFVKAAESCFVAQPTLTLQVKKLEEEISLTIFDRTAKPLQPTLMGEKFIIKARQILREIEGLKEMVNLERDVLKGTYKIAVIPTLAPYLLPLFLKKFSDEHPDLKLEIREMQSDDIITALNNGTVDIGLLVTPTYTNHLREVVLFKEPFLIYAHKEHRIFQKKKITPEDLNEKGLWLLDQGHCFRDQVLNICGNDSGISASNQISFETGSIETLKKMIQSHSGYTLIPQLSAASGDEDFIRHFEEPEPAREVGLVVHNSFTKELLLTKLRKAILEVIPENFIKNQRFITVKWR